MWWLYNTIYYTERHLELVKAACYYILKNRFPNIVCYLGGASGIGRATVERLANEGATVAVFDINSEAGQKLAGLFTFQPQEYIVLHIYHNPYHSS